MTKNNKVVYVENNDTLICKMFREEGWHCTSNLEEADLVCVVGGADVSPCLYGAEVNGAVGYDVRRDIGTFGILSCAVLLNIPIVGICRGSQALCVFNGGTLVQHVEGHNRWHNLEISPGRFIEVSSAHHQAANITGLKVVENWTSSAIVMGQPQVSEVVKYDDHTLGFQPHPEYHEKGHDCRIFFFDLIRDITSEFSNGG